MQDVFLKFRSCVILYYIVIAVSETLSRHYDEDTIRRSVMNYLKNASDRNGGRVRRNTNINRIEPESVDDENV